MKTTHNILAALTPINTITKKKATTAIYHRLQERKDSKT